MKESPNVTGADPLRGPSEIPIPPHLQKKLESFRGQLWSVKIAEGALAGIVGLAVSYLTVFAMDRLVDTPQWLRWVILLSGVAVPALGIPLRWHRWVWKQRTLEQIARLLRHRYPRLGDQLLGIVELAHASQESDSPSAHSRTLVSAAMQQVDARVKDRDFSDAVPENHYRAWMVATLVFLTISFSALFLVSAAARNALTRWVTPWKLIPRYTFAQLKPLPDRMVVPYAEEFHFESQLRDTTRWRPRSAVLRIPERGKLISRPDHTGSYQFVVPPRKNDATLALRVGDAREKILVQPMVRPELTNLQVKLQLPDYLMYQDDQELPVRGGSVSIVKGAIATFSATTSRSLTYAREDGEPAAVSGSSFSSAPAKITYSQSHEFTWEDIYGLRAKSPLNLRIKAVEDEAPHVFAKKLTPEQVVLVSDVISFDITAKDDFGIHKVGLEWKGIAAPSNGIQPDAGEKLVSAGKPQTKEIETRGTFSAAREKVKPQTLQLRVFAEDYLPNRPRSYSQLFILHVLSPQDHAKWLTDEFGKWFRHAREVYEREQQLYETNKNLRQLPSAELDRPSNRRRIAQEARAETNNARRLSSLSKLGRDLVRQATRNEEFDATRLESWARMMRALDDIAGKRMPGVADLLKKSSQAAGGGQTMPDTVKDQQNSRKKPSGPSVKTDQDSNQTSPSTSPKTDGKNPPPVPSISDRESSLAEQDTGTPAGQKNTPPGQQGRLTLPTTTLKGNSANPKTQGEPQPETPAQEKLGEALSKQKDLIAEFAKVAEQLQDILSSLETSTFVKRLKAASRKQLAIATDLNQTLAGGFGLPKDQIMQQLREVGDRSAELEGRESEVIYTIQSDLDAYFQRKQDVIYKKVLDQMRDLSVVEKLKQVRDELLVNLSGRSISAAEYWADTLDRWAEELVASSKSKASKNGANKDSLPPEIVLKIMKILREEMDLREETRELEATRPGIASDQYRSNAKPLEMNQSDLRQRLDEVTQEITGLPAAMRNFEKELRLLTTVSDVMRQSRAILSRPDTGPDAIAAETEVIELLLQANRQDPKGGGGGGSNPGGGGSASGAAALTDISIGGGAEPSGRPTQREVGQATGKAGREFPEEFRLGLDNYFNTLDNN